VAISQALNKIGRPEILSTFPVTDSLQLQLCNKFGYVLVDPKA
jgi:hypothetical protein